MNLAAKEKSAIGERVGWLVPEEYPSETSKAIVMQKVMQPCETMSASDTGRL